MNITNDSVLNDIQGAILDVVGPEWADEMDITPDTNMTTGIELDSIEISKVIEAMFQRYPHVRFEEWFASMDIQRIMALTLGDIADFVVRESQGVSSA
ncbi:hypothetical protein [Saccharospirillum salsuginis]|uniref:Acyl carrier protein n=1 Tax=Saccharospirillum salsuginis TaxID=418750 RepID=A0A918NHF2_9GAMM|nr:hypothetical protein [Saccharospirillum salsuginis]GGX67913.1 hypothetical protein GCM10007392_39520 [Saccharospirillum salsuginis]